MLGNVRLHQLHLPEFHVRSSGVRIAKAKVVVFLGDGAVWVWKLARVNFPDAICILDYYHACEHLQLLADALDGEGSAAAKRRFRRWRKALLKDKITDIIAQAKNDLPSGKPRRRLAQKQIAYFHRNRAKMTYQTFRQAGYFIGSGVVEAACKALRAAAGFFLSSANCAWTAGSQSDCICVSSG